MWFSGFRGAMGIYFLIYIYNLLILSLLPAMQGLGIFDIK